MKKLWNHLRYRQKLIILFLILTLIPTLLFCGYYFTVSITAKVNEMLTNAGILLDSGTDGVNILFRGSLEKMAALDRNTQLQFYLINDSHSPNQITSLSNIMDFYDSLETIDDVMRAGNPDWRVRIYAYNEDILTSGFILKIGEMDAAIRPVADTLKPGIVRWQYGFNQVRPVPLLTTGSDNQSRQTADKSSVPGKGPIPLPSIVILKRNFAADGRPVSVEYVEIGMDSIRRSFATDLPQGSILLYQSAGNDRYLLQAETANPTDVANAAAGTALNAYYHVKRTVKINGDTILLLIPKKTVMAKLTVPLITAVIVILFLICLVYLLVTLISRTLTKRMNTLFEETNAEWANLDVLDSTTPEHMYEDDEFGKISARFHELVQKIKAFYFRESGLMTEKKVLEMELLQSLINPHFLYNTLDGIKWAYPDEKLSGVVDSMVRYYRIALNRGNTILTVAQEINMVEEYLKLQQFAYESEFRYQMDIPADMLSCRMIKHFLQPIVENAVLHGIDKQSSAGRILIVGRHEGGMLSFSLSDNGTGMLPEKLKSVLKGQEKSLQCGYGLFNIRKRLELFYGSTASLSIRSEPGEGTTVVIRFPDEVS